MRWQGRRQSGNVEDRRGMGGGRKVAVGGGLGGVVILVLYFLLGGNPQDLTQLSTDAPGAGATETRALTPEEKAEGEFVAVVLADTEDVWHELFRQSGKTYSEPGLVLFTGGSESGCGFAQAAMGPFYCPADEKVYLDLDFLRELQDRLGAGGDFARAYIIAHEVGHHVQKLLGVMEDVERRREGLGGRQANALTVRMELQADFLAGVWAHHAQRMKDILEQGDIEEAMNAAAAVGDDRIQRQTQGYVVPDSFTHGTSAQRLKWFKLGFETGELNRGDTFK